MPKFRNYTKVLREAQENGARIFCSIGPEEEVVYLPRNRTDPEPWVLASEPDSLWRYDGRRCHAVHPEKEKK